MQVMQGLLRLWLRGALAFAPVWPDLRFPYSMESHAKAARRICLVQTSLLRVFF